MYQDQTQLINELVKQNLLTKEQADQLMAQADTSKKTLEELIISQNLVSAKEIIEAKSKILDIPVADLKGKKIVKKLLDLVPKEVAENYQMIPFELKGNELQVGLVNPQNFKAIEAIEFLAQKNSLKVRYFIISLEDFKSSLSQYQILGEEVKLAMSQIQEPEMEKSANLKDLKEMEEVIKSAPVSKIVLVIIRHAIDGRSSDIHIEPTSKDTRVRYRIDGVLRTSLVLPKYIHSAIVGRIKVLSNLKLDETRKPQDGRIRLNIEGRNIDFRVSTLPLVEGEKIVLRILDSESRVPTLEQLGINDIQIEIIKKGIKKPYGLILLTGPTGSGKTTTLYTLLTMLNQEGVNIVTLEDPIEYYVDGINQSQIRPEIGYTFADGLRAILRQDPNIAMVGEIRDKETTQLVIQESLTGHLIFSTLHTKTAIGAIPRLIDLGGEPFLLSSVLDLLIAQRLVRKICPDCKKETSIPPRLLKRVKEKLVNVPSDYLKGIDIENMKFYQGQGCAHCGNLGYQGRVAIAEVIDINNEMQEIIYHGGDSKAIKKALENQNFISLTQDAIIKSLKGITTINEVIRVAGL